MRRFLLAMGLAALVCGLLMAMAIPAGAAQSNGNCGGSGTSFDSDNKKQDEASAPGPGGTKGNPFDVWADGTVEYDAFIKGDGAGDWKVKVQKTPITVSDDIKASSGPDDSGTEPMEDYFQPGGVNAIIGLYKVNIEGERGGTPCLVSGWIHVHGSLLTAPMFWGGVILTGFGAWSALGLLKP